MDEGGGRLKEGQFRNLTRGQGYFGNFTVEG